MVISTVPEPVRSETELGTTVTVAPGAAGDKIAVTFTLPAKPFRLDSEITYVPCDPCAMESNSGLVDIVKSGLLDFGAFPANRLLVAKTPPITPIKRSERIE